MRKHCLEFVNRSALGILRGFCDWLGLGFSSLRVRFQVRAGEAFLGFRLLVWICISLEMFSLIEWEICF